MKEIPNPSRRATMTIQRIGPYMIEGVLGRGGMGTVYRGCHETSSERHAIKVLAPNFADDEHFRGRFESEIKALLKLNHPNIVKLLSYGQEDGMLFFAMELVEGSSLFQMQRQGHRFDWPQVLQISKDCVQGLRHAHDRGVIHRDLKPGNLLMADAQGEQPEHVKLTDFGIAKRFGNSQNTGTNILGTMDFMSPEQARGERVNARSDLYSLGTVMYTLLAGRPPFQAQSVQESVHNLTSVPAPRIRSLRPEVPRGLDELIFKLMAKRPEDRIPTAQALWHRLCDLEADLRDNSEADTFHGTPKPGSTFVEVQPGVDPNTAALHEITEQATSADPSPVADPTALLTEATPAEPDVNPVTQVNFFNTVTDRIREQQASPELLGQDEPRSGVLPILLALLAVIAVSIFGVWWVNRPPSADQLYARIEPFERQPSQALDDMELFLQHYPEEPRADQVTRWLEAGTAIRKLTALSNTLAVRSNSPGGLSEIEKQFLEIVRLGDTDPEAASVKMAAFIRVHQATNLDERDQKCVDAAAGFDTQLAYDARNQLLFNLEQIESTMAQANATDDAAEAIELYGSIVKLYGDFEWGNSAEAQRGRGLVDQARRRRAELEKSLQEAPEPPPSDSPTDQ